MAATVSVQRGRVLSTNLARHAVATVQPSSILRQQTPEDRSREMSRLTADLKAVAELINGKK